MSKISAQQALVHMMVMMSAADRSMTDRELSKIGLIVRSLPIFADYNVDNLIDDAEACSKILQEEDGMNSVIGNVLDVLPKHLHETAYAVVVEVAAADLKLEQEELRLLQIMRQKLNLDRLACAAIERSARARHTTL